MRSNNANLVLTVIICSFFCTISTVHCSDVQELDYLIRTYAELAISRRHSTGSLYNIKLPASLSAVDASVVTIRNSAFWRKGLNFSDFYIPSMIKTTPYSKRIAFVYENFRNLSSTYFQIAADHSFVSPVVGFSAYDASNPQNLGGKLNLSINGNESIMIRFDSYITHHVKNKTSIKCAALDSHNTAAGVTLKFSDMTRSYGCATTSSSGHFVLVALNRKTESEVASKWRWMATAVAGVIFVCLVLMVVLKLMKKRKIREMEKESEKGEMMRNMRIGRSRMPAAATVRTQPCIEQNEDLAL